MAYKGDLGAAMFDEHLVEWVDFQVQLKARYHLAFEDVDAIYVRSLKDVELGMRVTDARGTKAVLAGAEAAWRRNAPFMALPAGGKTPPELY